MRAGSAGTPKPASLSARYVRGFDVVLVTNRYGMRGGVRPGDHVRAAGNRLVPDEEHAIDVEEQAARGRLGGCWALDAHANDRRTTAA